MDKPLRTVLIGSSLSAESDSVVQVGAALAQAAGAAAHVVHAFTPAATYTLMPSEYLGVEAEWLEAELSTASRELEGQMERTGLSGTPRHLRTGPAHRVLTEMAVQLAADLVVVGTHERGGIRLPAIGSTADRVLRKAHCPVLVVRPGSAWPPERVLAPVDLSAASHAAVATGLGVLAQTGWTARETEVLFVLNPFERAGSVHFTPEQVDRFAAEELERLVREGLPAAAGPVRTRLRHGYAGKEILAEAERAGADLLILGTHGRSGFERLLIGSVAAEVLRETPASVLVVPPEVAVRQMAAEAERSRSWADWIHVSDQVPTPA